MACMKQVLSKCILPVSMRSKRFQGPEYEGDETLADRSRYFENPIRPRMAFLIGAV